MKRIRWAAIGAAIIALSAGAADLEAAPRTGSVSVSATVLDACIPSATNLAVGAYAVRSTPYAAWIATAAAGSDAPTAGANEIPPPQPARKTLCRVPLQQTVSPAVLREDLVVTVNY